MLNIIHKRFKNEHLDEIHINNITESKIRSNSKTNKFSEKAGGRSYLKPLSILNNIGTNIIQSVKVHSTLNKQKAYERLNYNLDNLSINNNSSKIPFKKINMCDSPINYYDKKNVFQNLNKKPLIQYSSFIILPSVLTKENNKIELIIPSLDSIYLIYLEDTIFVKEEKYICVDEDCLNSQMKLLKIWLEIEIVY